METVDEELLDASLRFMERAVKDDNPFFVWWYSTRMHIFTHLKKESEGTVKEIVERADAPWPCARTLFEKLWSYDQVAFDASRTA